MAEYEHGRMDITQQKQMFATFWNWTVRSSIGIAVLLGLMYVFLT